MDMPQKTVILFLKLAETTGYITHKQAASLQSKIRRLGGQDSQSQSQTLAASLQTVIKQIKLPQEVITQLWQLAKSAPALKNNSQASTVAENKSIIKVEDLAAELREQIIFAEELLRQRMVTIDAVNDALGEIQKNPSKLSLGQMLLRRHLIAPSQFVQIKQRLQQDNTQKIDARLTLNQRTGVVQLLESNIPQYIGKYEIIREIARGGMGVVYEAKDPELNRTVALKTLLAGELADTQEIERFHREAQLTASFNHPGIVPIHEVGIQDNIHYLIMDYIDGMSLSEYVNKAKLPLRKVAKMILQIADALDYAHNMGVIHRDIKPGNILVDTSGKPLLTDFGLARQRESEQSLTMSGVALGTPSYMPPEQAEGKIREIDLRSDIYSLGAVFYELLAGRPPFSGTSLAETLQAVIHDPPVSLRKLVPGLPAAVDTICLKCLAKNKKHRYPNAKALMRDLERFLSGGTIRAKNSGSLGQLKLLIIKNKLHAYMYGLLITLTILLAAIAGHLGNRKANYPATNSATPPVASSPPAENIDQHKLARLQQQVQQLEDKLKLAGKERLGLLQKLGDAYITCGIFFANTRAWTESISMSSKAIAIAEELAPLTIPRLFHAYNNRGVMYYKKGMLPKALADFNKTIAIKSDYSYGYKHRGMIYLKQDKPAEALADFNKAIELAPQLATLYNERARAYLYLKQYQDAIKDFDHALKLSPDNLLIRNNRADLHTLLKNYQLARKDYLVCIKHKYKYEENREKLLKVSHKLKQQ